MKLNNSQNTNRKAGMTLLELTVVILVLLSLITVLFVGARAWKRGSDRAGCLINIRNIQVAMRGDQNMRNSAPGGPGLDQANIIGGANAYITNPPVCPTDKVTQYTLLGNGNYPALGTLYATCASAESSYHVYTAAETADW